MRAVKGVTLNVANKVYIKDGDYDLNEQLKTDAIKVFDAGLEKVNFVDGAAAANLINQWVSFEFLFIIIIVVELTCTVSNKAIFAPTQCKSFQCSILKCNKIINFFPIYKS